MILHCVGARYGGSPVFAAHRMSDGVVIRGIDRQLVFDIYVGDESGFDSADSSQGTHGRRRCPVTGLWYSNLHTGRCGPTQVSFLNGSVPGMDPNDPINFAQRCTGEQAGCTIDRLVDMLLRCCERASNA